MNSCPDDNALVNDLISSHEGIPNGSNVLRKVSTWSALNDKLSYYRKTIGELEDQLKTANARIAELEDQLEKANLLTRTQK